MLSKIIHRTVENVSEERLSSYKSVAFSSRQFAQLPGKTLLLVNSLSLDAPVVAVTWLWCFSAVYSTKINLPHYFILFSVTWLAYLGDRLLDSLRMPDISDRTPRHQFTSKFSRPLIVCWGLMALVSVICLFQSLTVMELILGFSLLFVLAVYFLGCFYIPGYARSLLPRELLVGIFFSIATHFFIWTHIREWNSGFVWTFFCFLFLCALNCVCISRWEFQSDRSTGEISFFTRYPEQLRQVPRILTGFIVIIALIFCLTTSMNGLPLFEMSVLLSSVMLLVLDQCPVELKFKPVLADCALLTPCLFLSTRL